VYVVEIMKTIACCYTRVSGQSQVAGDGHPRQEDSVRSFAYPHDFEMVEWFNEDAVSGKSEIEDRPKFQEMIAFCLAGECKTIVVEALDRLAREYRVQEQLLIYIASKGLSLIAANTGENVTEALVQIQGILAELDKNLIVSKLMKARKRMRENGERCEGQKPYGSRPGEEEVITVILEARSRNGWTAKEIAIGLNLNGLSTRHGKPWTSTQVRRILARQKSVSNPLATSPSPDRPVSSVSLGQSSPE
jgi:DNA invertase Pin-like site-specific DNA recombinase